MIEFLNWLYASGTNFIKFIFFLFIMWWWFLTVFGLCLDKVKLIIYKGWEEDKKK